MKHFAKLIALVLALVLVLSLAACKKAEEVKAPEAPGLPAELESVEATDLPDVNVDVPTIPVTDDPASEPPETNAPETDAPETLPPVEEENWFVIGTLNGTNWDTDFAMEAGGGVYTYGPVELAAGTELKCRKNNDWTENMGTDGPNGANLVVEADGTYTVILDLAANTVYLHDTGKQPGGEVVAPATDPALIGVWKGEIAMEKLMEITAESGSADEDSIAMAIALFSGSPLVVNLEFTADGKLIYSVDPASAEGLVDTMLANLPDLLPSMLGLSREEMEAALAQQGMTMDDFVALMAEQLNPEDMLEGIEDATTVASYAVDGDKIYLGDEDMAPSTDEYLVFTCTGSKLTLVEIVGENTDTGAMADLLPWEFTKAD